MQTGYLNSLSATPDMEVHSSAEEAGNDLSSFFKPKIILPGTASQRIIKAQREAQAEKNVDHEPRQLGFDYVEEFKKQEQKNFELNSLARHDPICDDLERMNEADKEDKLKVYEKYEFKKLKSSKDLPINEHKKEILHILEKEKVIVINSHPACGKTTQVPQYILHSARTQRQYCNIVITQPRRIAAIRAAKRVALENTSSLGSLIGYQEQQKTDYKTKKNIKEEVFGDKMYYITLGYQIRQKKMSNKDTRILYCTTEVLLQKLIHQKHMNEFTHVILDDLQECSPEMDFLMMVVRKFLNSNSPKVKVILMSTNMDSQIYSDYFYTFSQGRKQHAAELEVHQRRNNVDDYFFLDDIQAIVDRAKEIKLHPNEPEIEKESYDVAVRLIRFFETREKGVSDRKNTKNSVLVFLPGMTEIEEMHALLKSEQKDSLRRQQTPHSWNVHHLHSLTPFIAQEAIFTESQARKIILATNIAECSLTFPNVKYIIDFCRTKTKVLDPETNFHHLKLEWASKKSLIQRASRAIRNCHVYRLITEQFFETNLAEESTPKMLHCPMDRLVLQAKLLQMEEPKAIFAVTPNPPSLENMEQAVSSLKEIGALLVSSNGRLNPHDGDLTTMGLLLAKLPLDLRLGKLVFFGAMCNVLEECIIMACGMSVKNMFVQPESKFIQAYKAKLKWAGSNGSDCITFYYVFKEWQRCQVEGQFEDEDQERAWAREHFVQISTLHEVELMKKDIEYRLVNNKIDLSDGSEIKMDQKDKILLMKVVLAAAFYPHYFFNDTYSYNIEECEREALKTLEGLDPFSTVYLKGMPHNQPADLYKDLIRKEFDECSTNIKLKVSTCGSKIFVNFGRSSEDDGNTPGKMAAAVYRAVKIRQQPNREIRVPLLSPEEASRLHKKYLNRCKIIRELDTPKFTNSTLLPWPWRRDTCESYLESNSVRASVSYIETPNRFWLRYSSFDVDTQLLNIQELLNEENNLENVTGQLHVGQICAALDENEEDDTFYRCRIISRDNRENTYDIYFIDYGNSRLNVPIQELRTFSKTLCRKHKVDMIPDLVIECSLRKIRPLRTVTDDGRWSDSAIETMRSICEEKTLLAEIYSIVNDVANVELRIITPSPNSYPTSRTINEILLRGGLAEKCDDSYQSILNHEDRNRIRQLPIEDIREIVVRRSKMTELDELALTLEECVQDVVLKGPFSPLEMRLISPVTSSMGKQVDIHHSSVNSVLLNSSPSDSYQRMFVACSVTANQNGHHLTLRGTTQMPNIPAVPALISLLFSPMVELRRNPAKTTLTGAVCGLGYKRSSGRALYADHDFEVVFDVNFSLEDVERINRIRNYMNRVVNGDLTELSHIRVNLVALIMDLFGRQYEMQDLNYVTCTREWAQLPDNEMLEPTDSIDHPGDDFSSVYRLIWGVELHEDSPEEAEMIAQNVEKLHKFANDKLKRKEIECISCRVLLETPISAKLHLSSVQHERRQKRIQPPS